MSDEEKKIHQENDGWIARWVKLEELLVAKERATESEYHQQLADECRARAKALNEEYARFSIERQEFINELKMAHARQQDDLATYAQRRERVALALLVAPDSKTQTPAEIYGWVDTVMEILDTLEEEP